MKVPFLLLFFFFCFTSGDDEPSFPGWVQAFKRVYPSKQSEHTAQQSFEVNSKVLTDLLSGGGEVTLEGMDVGHKVKIYSKLREELDIEPSEFARILRDHVQYAESCSEEVPRNETEEEEEEGDTNVPEHPNRQWWRENVNDVLSAAVAVVGVTAVCHHVLLKHTFLFAAMYATLILTLSFLVSNTLSGKNTAELVRIE